MVKQYAKIATKENLRKIKSSLPEGWRVELPNFTGVSIATLDNFFRGQKVKQITVNKILAGIEAYKEAKEKEFSQFKQKISQYAS